MSDFDELADTVERLAVLLGAGVAPASAWEYVGGRLAARSQAVRGLDAAWDVATDAGAPLADTLHRFAASLRGLAENERDARTALAGPLATTRLILVLPLIGVLFELALGFDTVGTLFTTVPGWCCLALGLLLVAAAHLWSRRLLRSARPPSAVPGLGFDLVAIAVSGGASIPRALAVVEAAQSRHQLPPDAVGDILSLSSRAGVPAALLLRSAAEQARREARALGRRKAETLAVTLMLPLGVCVLPAFMLLVVVPMLISVLGSTVGSL